MLQKLQKRNKDQGFTIIEVMIVLAIAGLILLIVFLAVPALQRTARNTSRKNDASAIASAIANYIDDNGGTLPTGLGSAGSDTTTLVIGTLNATYSGSPPSWTSNTETAKLGYYSVNGTTTTLGANDGSKNIYISNAGSATVTPSVVAVGGTIGADSIDTNMVSIITGEGCNSTNTQGGNPNGRTAAIFYVTETGSGNGSLQCVEQ